MLARIRNVISDLLHEYFFDIIRQLNLLLSIGKNSDGDAVVLGVSLSRYYKLLDQ